MGSSVVMRNDLLDLVSWNGFKSVQGPIRGIVIRFHGLGSMNMKSAADGGDLDMGAKGALMIEVFQDPWGWMNDATRDLFDEVVDGLRKRHGLSDALPLILTGGSMGGHAALAYTFRSRHRVTACQVCCPVCDLPFHYTERPDLPRTFHHAYGYSDISERLAHCSPLHQVGKLPDIPYQIIHGVLDKAVSKAKHSDPLVKTMLERGLQVEYLEDAEMRHCAPMSYMSHVRWGGFLLEHLR
jgi:hypothetical protein